MADSGSRPPHILIITFPASGHIIPQLKLAHHLLKAGVKLTFLLTPKNLKRLKPLQNLHTPDKVQTLVLPLPDTPGLPPGVENLADVPGVHFAPLFVQAYAKLSAPIGEWVESHSDPPVAIMCDIFFSEEAQRLAVRLGIKLIGFSPQNALCVRGFWGHPEAASVNRAIVESWALVFNTFEGLDDEHVEFYRDKIGRVYAVAPLLLLESGATESPGQLEPCKVMEWLDECSHANNSVVFIAFGTQIDLNQTQIRAIAGALDASGCSFIWAVKKPVDTKSGDITAAGFPNGLAEKRGIITTEWVPQRAILSHPAVGAFLTHAGWNSAVEGLVGGVLMLLWPMQADQHDNARMLADELRVAVRVCDGSDAVPDPAQLAMALADATRADGSYADVRKRAVELGKKAVEAIDEEKAGSSVKSVKEFVKQVKALSSPQF